MAREEIRCHGRLLAEIDVEERKLYLWCKWHHTAESIDLRPYIERMLARESESTEQGESEPGIRLLRAV